MGTEPYIGEIRLFAFNFAPKHWAMCNGQLLAINQNQALFSILGTTYGGNGQTTFALPNLQGRVPVHPGSGINWGTQGGSAAVTLTSNQISHSHAVAASQTPNSFAAASNYPASAPSGSVLYGATPDTTMLPTVIGPAGGSQAHNNMQPYLVLTYCICLTGIFPSRN